MFRYIYLLSFLILTAGCGKPEASGPPPARPPANVSAAVARAEDIPVYLDEIGRAASRETVVIQPQVSGQIEKVHVADGASVKAGDTLFTIDPRPYEAQLAQAAAALAQREAELELARLEADRSARLVKTGGVTAQDIDQRKSAVQVAVAQKKAAQAALDTAKLNLEFCTIRSPIDGRAGQRLVDAGNIVRSGETTNLLVIQRLDPIYADFSIPEGKLLEVQTSAKAASGPLPVEVRLPELADQPRLGGLTFIDSAVGEGAGSVRLRATLPNPDFLIWPGRFIKVRLILRTIPKAVLVPAVAVQTAAAGPFVYVIDKDSKAELRPVVVGQRHGESIHAREGLKAGEKVVTVGHLAVMPSGPVNVVAPETKKP